MLSWQYTLECRPLFAVSSTFYGGRPLPTIWFTETVQSSSNNVMSNKSPCFVWELARLMLPTFMDPCEHRFLMTSRFIGKKSITDVIYCQVVLEIVMSRMGSELCRRVDSMHESYAVCPRFGPRLGGPPSRK